MKTKYYITGTILLCILMALITLFGCQRKTFCYYQTNEIDLRIKTPDTLGHYEGKSCNKYGDLRVEWQTGLNEKTYNKKRK